MDPADALHVVGGVEVSRNDRRGYRALTLPNGLRTLLISDAEADTCAAALAVGVGSHHDPPELQGAFHFLEHMLFLGTETFPDENSYSVYLSEHGGQSNAYTASDATVYHWDAAPDALEGGLDRFAAFFTCPLFTESATARELNAVDAEHGKNLQSDVWRDHQLEASTSRPGHSASKFGTGDSRTLRDQPAAQGLDVRARLLALHGAHYSASRMALVVLGREPLDELQALAAARFSAVPNNGSATPVEAAHPWGAGAGGAADGYCGLQQWVVPIKDTRTLTLSWAMPEVRSRFAAKPHSYLSHLLGHEGPGSVLSCLKGRGLATELSCGTNDSEAGYSTFSVQVALTADGLARADEVAAVVYAYVGLLRAHGPLRWVHDELAGTAAVSFRFRAASRPINTVTRLAHSMLELPTAVAASGAYLLTAWDPAGVAELLRCLTPANSRVRLSAQALAERCPLTEPWYGVRYGQAPIGDELAARWAAAADGYEALTRARAGGRDGDGELAGVDAWAASLAPSLRLPEPNEFIAADFALKHPALAAREAAAAASVAGAPRAAPREPVPVLLLDEPGRSVWHHLDDSFGVPKAYVHAELALPGGYASPRAIVLSDLYVRLLKEALSELAYAAELAELAYSAHATIRGVALTVGGFSHKLAALCARIGERVAGLAFTDAQFAIQLDRAVREAANWDFSQPYQLAAYDASVATCAPKWHLDERRRVLAAGVGADELRRFIAGTLLATAHATVLVSGNAAPGDALALADVLLAPLAAASTPPAPAQLAGIRIVALPAPTPLGAQPSAHHVAWEFVHTQPARNPRDPNAALDLLLQVGPQGAGPQCSGNALVDLAAHMLAEPFFDTLRTKQALGYIVMCASKSEGGVDWLRFLVQSNKVAPGELVERTEAFLAAFAASLRALPPAKFASNVEAVVSKKLEADKSLSEEAARLWGEVRDGTLDFARASQEVAALRSLCQVDFVRWFDDVVAPGGARRRFFASLVEAGGGGGAGGCAEAGEAAAAAATAADDDDEEAAEADAAMAEMGGEGEGEDGGAGPLSPGLVPGQPAPTGGDGGLAREDRLAPLGVHADASAASAAVAQSPTTAACVAASRAARTLSVASGQAAAVLHALHSHAHVAGAPLAPVLAAAFASVGVDAAPQLAAAAAAGAALHVRVALGGVGDMRAVLPLHADAGAMRAAAWRHQRQQQLLQGGGQGAAAPA